jgi:uncharacterized lipoprotein
MNRLIVVAIACLGSACAFTEDRVHLRYSPMEGARQLAGADGVIATVTVRDGRADRSRVSVKKNGFGVEAAAIRSDAPVERVVLAAVETELRQRGVKLNNSGTIVIALEVTRLWNDFKMGMFTGDAIADFQVNVLVRTPSGQVRFVRNYGVSGEERGIQLASGTNAELALDRALETGIHQIFDDSAFLAAIVPGSS